MNVAPKIVPAEDVGLISSRLAAIPKFMQAYIDSGKLASASTLVSRRDEIAHFECLGVKDKWGGAASTNFWIDPEEDMIAILMTQLYPSSTYPLRPQPGQLVYAAIGD